MGAVVVGLESTAEAILIVIEFFEGSLARTDVEHGEILVLLGEGGVGFGTEGGLIEGLTFLFLGLCVSNGDCI
ncbi:hypothetical protein SESBI_02436 [Sesbania bispinosa]|nr:hypothetical protein SESBI_02436 [Sesbania bispinosa]